MTVQTLPHLEVIDLAPGLWIWRLEHPGWKPEVDWQQVVTCVCVDAGAERWLLDPLHPPDDAAQVWDRLAERPPMAAAVLIPDHMRRTWSNPKTKSVDAAVRRYGCRAFGPSVFDPDDGPPETALEMIEPGRELRVDCAHSGIPEAGTRRRSRFPSIGLSDALTEPAGEHTSRQSPFHARRRRWSAQPVEHTAGAACPSLVRANSWLK